MTDEEITNVLELTFGMNSPGVNDSEVIKRTFSNKQLQERFKTAAGILKPKIEAYGYKREIDGLDKAKEILKEG